ncbi:phage infection protein [[Clostridium] sordellii]|uniref:YhgE/Pip domain-containing protein n=1 Tax=Paraclostridium sordellii TaxID=1505 RepID=UPI0005DF9E69|nr:YhgE/Pip domain-containing protein [Paeniclostridium sordellii]CEP95734.1 phage infection protein [[Clostridium] sordellii] [Paeniclostridium sordellii]
MKKAIKVFKRDIKNLSRNPIALIIIIGVCFLPSLYAWVNIKACWNPYENTSTVPIAIVNNDKGATLDGKKLNVGNDVISELRRNKKIGWKFVSQEKGSHGVLDGTYYAMIEIPSDFTKDLTSVATGKPKKPTIIYKVNTKSNPVAGKITEVAEETLVNQINSNFIATVNKTIFSSLNTYGKDIEDSKDTIVEVKKAVIALDEHMDLINFILDSVNNNSANLTEYLKSIQSTLPQVSNGIDSVSKANLNTSENIKNIKDSLNNSFNGIDSTLNQINNQNNQIKDIVNNLNNSDSASKEAAKTAISQINKQIDNSKSQIDSIVKYLKEFNKVKPNEKINKLINNLENIKDQLDTEKDSLGSLNSKLNESVDSIKETIDSVNSTLSSLSNNVNSAIDSYDSQVRPALNNTADSLVTATKDASSLVESSKGLVKAVNDMLGYTSQGSDLTSEMSKDLDNKLNQFKETIHMLSTELKKVNDNDLDGIIAILQSKPEVMGNYISNPFNLKSEPIYPIANYGSGMAPIYTTLALWVGGIVLVSLMTTEAEGFEDLRIKEKYLGKMITFVFFAMVQGFIVALGDKLVLGVQTESLGLFIFTAVLSSAVFAIILYTLVSLFGNIGKAIGIVMMVMQIAGSGGTYPIQVDPLIFRILQPFFPFTYTLSNLREAIAGPLLSTVMFNVVILIVFGVINILIGYFLKERLNKSVTRFEKEFKESGLSE